MEKSHVSMAQKKCIVTGINFDSGEILLDKRFRKSLERNTVTGWGISPEVQEKLDEGYVALVVIDEEKSTIKNGVINPEDAYRTGKIAYLRRHILNELIPDLKEDIPFIFVTEDFIQGLEKLQVKETSEDTEETSQEGPADTIEE